MEDSERAPDALLQPHEVATIFGVDPKTVYRWQQSGKIEAVWTLGGHRRFKQSEVDRVLALAKATAEAVTEEAS